MRVRHRRLHGAGVFRRVFQDRGRRRGDPLPHLWARRVRKALALGLALAAVSARADVYYMVDGDRITGKTLSEAQGLFKVDTPYGRVAIPKGRVAKIVHENGREEVLDSSATPRLAKRAGPTAPSVRLVVVVSGGAFWQAWSAKGGAPADTSLRLQVSLDEDPVAAYTDAKTDPEIPGATANSFSFAPGDVVPTGGGGASLQPAEARPGRITLKIDLPVEKAGERRLRFAYQANDGSTDSPAWRDLVDTMIHVVLSADKPNVVEIHQDRGRMEFSGFGRKKMKNVETFRIEARPI